MKRLILILTVALSAAVFVASAKDYSVTLSAPSAVGGLKLDKGQYTMKLTGALVFFNDTKGRSVSTIGTQEKTDKKFESTRVDAKDEGDIKRVTSIGLEGCDCRLVFGN